MQRYPLDGEMLLLKNVVQNKKVNFDNRHYNHIVVPAIYIFRLILYLIITFSMWTTLAFLITCSIYKELFTFK